MHTVLILLAVLALVPAAASRDAPRDPSVPAGWSPDMSAARHYAKSRKGEISFAVRTRAREWGYRRRSAVNSASVFKAMLLVAYLNHPDVRARALGDADRALLGPMIRYSDNDTATQVRDLLGAAPIERLARRAGMRDFRLAVPWGLSQINASDQSRYFLDLPELVARRHRAYARQLLAGVVEEQRWGIARVRPRGWKLHFKGGWGAGTGAVSHQVALLERDGQRVSVAIMTNGSPSHEYSQETLRGVALRLVRGLADVATADEEPSAGVRLARALERAAAPPPPATH